MGILYIFSSQADSIKVPESIFPSQTFETKSFLNLSIFFRELSETPSKQTILHWRKALSPFKMDVLYLSQPLIKNKNTLFVFDMDSTLIKQEVIDEVAREAGVFREVSLITEEAMQGNLDFESSLRKRCQLLKGTSVNIFNEIFTKLELNLGVRELLGDPFFSVSRKVILSGGFIPILQKFSEKYGFSDFKANHLSEVNGYLTGELIGEIIDGTKKKKYLEFFKNEYGVEQVVAIGDGANDIDMINSTPWGFGFFPKEGLKKGITNWIEFTPLYGILSLFE